MAALFRCQFCSSNGDSDSKAQVVITGTETKGPANKQFTVFVIEVVSCCSSWVVRRRFSDFCQLFDQLSQKYSAQSLPKLPPKKLLGSSLNPDFVEHRKEELQKFLDKLLEHPKAGLSSTFASFLSDSKKDPVSMLSEQVFDLQREVQLLAGKLNKFEVQMKRIEQVTATSFLRTTRSSSLVNDDTQLAEDIKFIKTRLFMLERGSHVTDDAVSDADLSVWQQTAQRKGKIHWGRSMSSHVFTPSLSQLEAAAQRSSERSLSSVFQKVFNRTRRTVSHRFMKLQSESQMRSLSDFGFARLSAARNEAVDGNSPSFHSVSNRSNDSHQLSQPLLSDKAPSATDKVLQQFSLDNGSQSDQHSHSQNTNSPLVPAELLTTEEKKVKLSALDPSTPAFVPQAFSSSPAFIGHNQYVLSQIPPLVAVPQPIDPPTVLHLLQSVELQKSIDNIVSCLAPDFPGIAKRLLVQQHVQLLIDRYLGCFSYAVGSFALRTFLPSGDLDIAVVFNKSLENQWINRMMNGLLSESHSQTQFPINNVTFINADTKLIKCNIAGIDVDLSANGVGALSALTLFEQVDMLVGKNHLFKRSLILLKAWAATVANILNSKAGKLSSYALSSIMLFIFNAFSFQITSPLHALYFFLDYTAHFDWNQYAIGLFGPIRLSSLPNFEIVMNTVSSWPMGGRPILSQTLLQKFSTVTHPPANQFIAKYINILDPCNHFSNVGRSVSYQHSEFVQQAFRAGYDNFVNILTTRISQFESLFFVDILAPYKERFRFNASIEEMKSLPLPEDPLNSNFADILKALDHCRQFQPMRLTEAELVQLVSIVLSKNGDVPVGKLGSLMHAHTNNHSLPAVIKEQYGGLKKFLARHPQIFFISDDHPYNPKVGLVAHQDNDPAAAQNLSKPPGFEHKSARVSGHRSPQSQSQQQPQQSRWLNPPGAQSASSRAQPNARSQI